MKAFISYSTNDNDQVIVTLLANNLRKQGFQIVTSSNFYSNILDYTTKIKIDNSHIFFGIITNHGEEKNRVLAERKYSIETKTPNILLIEDTVNINNNFQENYIVFNRYDPNKAVNEIQQRMKVNTKQNEDNNIWPWVIGGTALLGIISLLSKNE